MLRLVVSLTGLLGPQHGEVVGNDRVELSARPIGAGYIFRHVESVARYLSAMIRLSNAISMSGQVMCGLWLASISWEVQPGSPRARSANWRKTSPGACFLA